VLGIRTMNKILVSLCVLLLVVSCARENESHDNSTGETATVTGTSVPRGSIYTMDMMLENQNAQKIQWGSLRGKVQVMAMVFTHCGATCPRITQDMKAIENLIPSSDKNSVGYTLISFDVKRDTAASLMTFYNEMGLDPNWQLLHGSEEDVQTIANLFDVKFKQMGDGSFSHESAILVIDRNGQIVLRQEGVGNDPNKIAAKVKSCL
jgi:protein SCO1